MNWLCRILVALAVVRCVDLLARDAPALGLASRYPREAGIERDPHVLFAENFERGTVEEIGKRWGQISNKDGKVAAISPDVPAQSSGKRSLEMTATLGENTGGHLYTKLSRGVDKAYARF